MSAPNNAHDEIRRLILAMREGCLPPEDAARLRTMLLTDPEAREAYVLYSYLCGSLEWDRSAQRSEVGDEGAGLADDTERRGDNERGRQGEGETRRSPAPASRRILVSLSPSLPLSPSVSLHASPLLGGAVLSYAVAVVVLGVGVLAAWTWSGLDCAGRDSSPRPGVFARGNPTASGPVLGGRITAMKDCRWVNLPTASAEVAKGRFAIQSGLLELTSHAGAKILLEGPAVFMADSYHGGYLAIGRLNVRMPRVEVAGRRAVVPSAPPDAKEGYGLLPFVVRTPTAKMTGGANSEFGVSVDHHGVSGVHVFQGCVDLRSPTDGDDARAGIPVLENCSARVDGGPVWTATIRRDPAVADLFARDISGGRLDRAAPAPTAPYGDIVPCGQFITNSIGADFAFQPDVARVAGGPGTANASAAQWKTRYTFRIAFESRADAREPGRPTLRGRYVARQYVSAIRINGRGVPVPKFGDGGSGETLRQFGEFAVESDLADGTNRLEIDVDDASPTLRNDLDTFKLRMNVEGSSVSPDWKVIRAKQPDGSNHTQGKERKAAEAGR